MSATAVILAAGLGTRMKSALPKACHPIAGQPMLRHLVGSLLPVFDRIVVVVGPDMPQVEKLAAQHPVVVQDERLGTAHAALQAAAHFGTGEVAVLYADNPLILSETFRALLERRQRGDVGLALLAMRPDDPGRYGRVLGGDGFVERIVEWADANATERAVGLCNAGVFCAPAQRMAHWLAAVRNDNAKREYYLTDVVGLARAEGERVAYVEAPFEELRGINSRAELAEAEAVVQRRLRARRAGGRRHHDRARHGFSAADTLLAPDVTIGPNVVFGPGVTVEGGVEINAFSHLVGCRVRAGAIVGPFARLRPGADVGAGAHVGNFVELKNTVLGDGAKANHLTYLGDAEIGAKTNIGAGTITCNYDGFEKHRTRIGAGVFVGSDSVLVAPVTVGDGAFIAAGSVITDAVEPDAMAFGRARQETKPGRAALFRAAAKARKEKR